ncbi:DUF1189 family protein [Alkalihalobacillus deserti]|uniref:DUF1189 family protein n=1 Tax=Alkalihalobacillus deserti TaxID=2879466 RepID=UPI001D1580DD|nr:DUF1189 family protein [Alkalihalobacillus deserti]
MNKKMNFFSRLIYSILKVKSYPFMAKQGLKTALLYLLFFSVIFGAIQYFQEGIEITQEAMIAISEEFSPTLFEKLENTLPIVLTITLILVSIVWFWVGKLISAIIIGFIGKILSSIQKVNIPFKSLYIMAIYSLTLPSILNVFCLVIFDVYFPFYLYYLLSAFYLWFGINNYKVQFEK